MMAMETAREAKRFATTRIIPKDFQMNLAIDLHRDPVGIGFSSTFVFSCVDDIGPFKTEKRRKQ